MYYETNTEIQSATVNIWFEYDIETQDEQGVFKGSESKFNSFDSVFRIDTNRESPSSTVRRATSLFLSLFLFATAGRAAACSTLAMIYGARASRGQRMWILIPDSYWLWQYSPHSTV